MTRHRKESVQQSVHVPEDHKRGFSFKFDSPSTPNPQTRPRNATQIKSANQAKSANQSKNASKYTKNSPVIPTTSTNTNTNANALQSPGIEARCRFKIRIQPKSSFWKQIFD